MIINSGSLKNSKITIPKGISGLRPTLAMIRESVFNILSPFTEGCIFHDIFCGSGIIGMQALSCGAQRAVFVDKNPVLIKNIHRHIYRFKLQDRAELLTVDALRYLNSINMMHLGAFSLAYLDPPYGFDRWKDIFQELDREGMPMDMVVIESSRMLKDYIDNLNFFDIYKYKEYSEKRLYYLIKRGYE